MKNEMPSVTSTYFITLIKDYLQGRKTSQEIMAVTAGVIPLDSEPDEATADITHQLSDAAREMNEHFYFDIVTHLSHAEDTVPTREGLLHHLEEYIAGHLSTQALLQWSTWHNMDAGETTAGMFDNIAVEYFCLDFLPRFYQQLGTDKYQRILDIFRLDIGDELKEKIAILLVLEKERQSFLFFLRDFVNQRKSSDDLDIYLMSKFGMDHKSFPYMEDLTNGTELSAVLQKATLLP